MSNDQKHYGSHHHWHYLYKKRRKRVLGISPKQIAIGQMISLVGAIIAGFHLDNNKVALAAIVGAFVVMPGVLDLNGSLGGALSAKINHRLEESNAKAWRVFTRALGFALVMALMAGSIVGLAGGLLTALLFNGDFLLVFKLALGAILLGALIGFPLIATLTVVLRKLGINPDDVMGPIETSFFDFLAVYTLVVVAGWLA
jgi:cation transporter-like permease